jgi:hypothetical protein
MRSNYDVREVYTGDGIQASFTFDFKIANLAHLLVTHVDPTGVQLWQSRGTETTYYTTVLNDDGLGGTITWVTGVPASLSTVIVLLADDEPKQESKYTADSRYTMKKIENTFDALSGQIQRIRYLLDRSLRLPEKWTTALTTELPEVITEAVPMVNAAGTAITLIPRSEFKGDKGDTGDSGFPSGGVDGQVLGTDGVTGVWRDFAFTGFSARFGAIFNSTSLQDTLAKILNITYTAPSISFSASGSGTVREKGASVASTTLTATVTKTSDPIDAVRFYQGATLLDTRTGTIPTGGVETYTYSIPFTDNISFSAQTQDDGSTGGPSIVSGSASFTFVYPYYNDAGAVGLSAAAVGALTKTIITSTATVVKTMTATAGQVFYFAYPAAYPSLTSILDVNGFETLGDWTLTTANITGLDASAQSYKIYEFNNPVTAGSYQYTFKR